MDSVEVRSMYHSLLANEPWLIEQWTKEAHKTCGVAMLAFKYRHDVREYCRERGSWWTQQFVQLRDWWSYGHIDGPTFEELLAHNGGSCEKIVEGAFRTNSIFDDIFSVANTPL